MKQSVATESIKLPKGWEYASIGDIVTLINGKAFKPSEWSDHGLPIIRIQNLNDPDKPFNYCSFEVDNKFQIDNGQLLFSWSGTPGTSFGAFIWNRGKAVLNQHIFRIEVNENFFEKKYLQHIINFNIAQYIAKAHGSAGLAHITKGKFEESLLQIPPFNEQKRIVSKIEKLFSKIDSVKSSLEQLKPQLKQYKQSLLKSAFEGKLTEKWRKKNDIKIKIIKDSLEHLILFSKNGFTGKPNNSKSGIPRLGIETITGSNSVYVNESNHKFIEINSSKIEKYLAKKGDLFICRQNGNKHYVGKSAVFKGQIEPMIFSDSLIQFRPNIDLVLSEYLAYFINSKLGRIQIEKFCTTTAGNYSINSTNLKKTIINFPSTKEQEQIILQLTQGFSLIENTENITNSMLEQLEVLQLSVLKQAFEGKLVPQESNDEPAKKLLEKIKIESTKKS